VVACEADTVRHVSATKRRAWRALSERLRESLPADVTGAFIGGTHARRFADNLLPGLPQLQIATMREQLSRGSGNELKATASGKRPAHAPYSSAALAGNAFGRWIGYESHLRVAGLGGFAQALVLEAKLKIAYGGGTANLDCFLADDDVIVGVESKLTEMLDEHAPVLWRAPYARAEMANMLQGGWSDVFSASLAGSWQPKHLGLEQLVKHALALQSRPAGERHLVYLYWEPTNGDHHPEVVAHRSEVAELRNRVGDAWPRLHTATYAELLGEWCALPAPEWISEHVAEMRSRYELSVPTE
jgi:hypothetical protein